MEQAKQDGEVYETREDFVKSLTKQFSPNVKLENIESLFYSFGSFLVLVSFVFFMMVFLLNHRKTIRRNLVRLSKILDKLRASLVARISIKNLAANLIGKFRRSSV